MWRVPRGGGHDDKAHPPIHPTRHTAGEDRWVAVVKKLLQLVYLPVIACYRLLVAEVYRLLVVACCRLPSSAIPKLHDDSFHDCSVPFLYPPYFSWCNDKRRLYEFVVRSFLACCSLDAVGYEMAVEVDVAGTLCGGGKSGGGRGDVPEEKNVLLVAYSLSVPSSLQS